MTKVLGVGDVGILRKVLLVPQLKKDLISECQSAREMGLAVDAKYLWKRAINDEGDALIKGLIQDESNLYVVDPAYFSDDSEALHVEAIDELEVTTAFAGMLDVVEETEEERLSRLNWKKLFSLHSRPVRAHVEPVTMERRLAWSDWANTFDIDEKTPPPQLITELHWFMTAAEYQAFEDPYYSDAECGRRVLIETAGPMARE